MAIRDILIWPNPRLMKISAPVELVDGKVPDEIKTLVRDMFLTMYDADGIGLAAPQVGALVRVVVVDIRAYEREQADGKVEIPSGETAIALINPVFSEKSGKLEWEEGCLSVPGETGMVTRSAKCRVDYVDVDGQPHHIQAEGLKAIALQHECDHLDGKLFVDYLSPLKRGVIKRKMLRLIEREEAAE
ncbi:MAG: peptide deformylase [Deltaproteobacteria bacterium]|nr:peptide deformylase [Deltaproteobacteria bacterium]